MAPEDSGGEAGALFEAYHDRICRYIAGMVRDPYEAEDLTQETFLRAFRPRDSLRDPNAVRGWLYRIATHTCLDRLRQRVPSVSMDQTEGARQLEEVRSATLRRSRPPSVRKPAPACSAAWNTCPTVIAR